MGRMRDFKPGIKEWDLWMARQQEEMSDAGVASLIGVTMDGS